MNAKCLWTGCRKPSDDQWWFCSTECCIKDYFIGNLSVDSIEEAILEFTKIIGDEFK